MPKVLRSHTGIHHWLTVIFFLCSKLALANSPIPNTVDEPIFLKSITANGHIESNQRLQLYLNTDNHACKGFYGKKNYHKACYRKLHLSGKTITEGIHITPTIQGQWRWASDYSLVFEPENFWRSGTKYQVTLDLDQMNTPKHLQFTRHDKRTYRLSVSTQALRISVDQFRFMQDPNQPQNKQSVGHIKVNYPIEKNTLQQAIAVFFDELNDNKQPSQIQGQTEGQTFTLQFHNEHGTSAAFSSPINTSADQDRYLWLNIAAHSVTPIFGGNKNPRITEKRIRIPGLKTWYKINDSRSITFRDDANKPHLAISVQTNVKTSVENFQEAVKLYLLPKRHPVQKAESTDQPYHWQNADEVSSSILKGAEELPYDLTDARDSTQFTLKHTAPKGRFILLEIREGLRAYADYTLAQGYRKVIRVPSTLPHDIEILHAGSILPLNGERKLALQARGTDQLKITVAHINQNHLHHFVSQTQGDIRQATFFSQFSELDIATLDTQSIPMAYHNDQDIQYASFDFSPFMKEKKQGVYVITLQGYKGNQAVGQSQRRFVLMTDMGLLVKHNADNTKPIYIVSFDQGKPVKKAEVSLLARNGQVLFHGKTNAQGMILLPDFSQSSGSQAPVAIIAQRDEDFAFIPYARRDRALNYSRFNTAGNRPLARGLNAFGFTDRGIFRPGESIHLGFILKNKDWTPLPSTLPLRFIVKDPQNNHVYEDTVTFDTEGLNAFTVDSQLSWLSGKYHAGIYLAEGGKSQDLLGATQFQLKNFEPDRLKINSQWLVKETPLTQPPKGWLKPTDLSAQMSLKNLFGTAATNRRATATLRLRPLVFSFPEYQHYQFFDATPAKRGTIVEKLSDSQTNDEGKAFFNLPLNQHPKHSYQLNLEVRGFEANSGRNVTAYSSLPVSSLDYVIGTKKDSSLSWLTRQDPIKPVSQAQSKVAPTVIDLIALDPNLSPIAVTDLTLTLSRKFYISTLVKRSDGHYAYDAVSQLEDVHSTPLSIPAEGYALKVPRHEVGEFVYRITDKTGTVVNKISFNVVGEGQHPKRHNYETILEVKTDKKQYQPGSDIALQISAPYQGAGLITLESDQVLAHQWFRTTKNDSLQTITIPKDFKGKGYITVSFVRDIKSKKIYLSPLSYAVIPFVADPASNTLEIDLTVPTTVKPGQDLAIEYQGNKDGKAIIYAVDEGILQVANYAIPDPLHFFVLNRALQVQTTQMLDLLMPEFSLVRELSQVGGGSARLSGAQAAKHLNPFRRKRLAPATYWSGLVEVSTNTKTLHWQVPDYFNGTLRFMAVASSQSAVGSHNEEVQVAADIVLTPNLPTTLAPGDSAAGSVTIANTGMKTPTLSLELTTNDGLSLIEQPDSSINVPLGTEASFPFKVKATQALGNGSLKLTVTGENQSFTTEATTSVRPLQAKTTRLKAEYLQGGEGSIYPNSDFYPQFAKRELSFSPLPTAFLSGLAQYLDGYPYGCTEQILSRAWPKLALHDLAEFSYQKEATQKQIHQIIAELRSRTTRSGGLGNWSDQEQPNLFLSVYALDFLSQARNKGFTLPDQIITDLIRSIRNGVNTEIKSITDARFKAYGIYLLTSQGIVTTNEITHLMRYFEAAKNHNWSEDITALYLAVSFELLQQKQLAKAYLNGFVTYLTENNLTHRQQHWQDIYHNPLTVHARGISLLARYFPETLASLDKAIVIRMASFIKEERYNTLSAALSIQALRDYLDVQATALSEAKWQVHLNDEPFELPEATARGYQFPIPIETQKIAFSLTPRQGFFYTLASSGYPKAMPQKPITQGMTIQRSYETQNGQALNRPVQIGEVITAVLQINAHDSQRLDNVAIVDLLPGGFELETQDSQPSHSQKKQNQQQQQKPSLLPQFVDRREDRILIFANIPSQPHQFRYQLRAINPGQFQVPPPYAESMYDITRQALGSGGTIEVILNEQAQ